MYISTCKKLTVEFNILTSAKLSHEYVGILTSQKSIVNIFIWYYSCWINVKQTCHNQHLSLQHFWPWWAGPAALEFTLRWQKGKINVTHGLGLGCKKRRRWSAEIISLDESSFIIFSASGWVQIWCTPTAQAWMSD